MKNLKNQKGFSLIEMLMLLGFTMLLSVFFLSALDSINNMKEESNKEKNHIEVSNNKTSNVESNKKKNINNTTDQTSTFLNQFLALPSIKKEGNIYEISVKPSDENQNKKIWKFFYFDNFIVTDLNRIDLLCDLFKSQSSNKIKSYNTKRITELYDSRQYIEISYKPLSLAMLANKNNEQELSACNINVKDDNLYMNDKQIVILTNINEI